MAPPKRHASRPLMEAAAAPLHPPRGLMSPDTAAFGTADLHLDVRRLLWCAVAVLAAALYLLRVTS